MDSNTIVKDLDMAVSTAFVETGSRVVESKVSNVYKGDYPIKDQSLVDFMAKPVLMTTASWSTGDAVDTNITVIQPHAAIAANTIWANKVSGYRLIRGTAVLRVELNASPFQAGRLLMWWMPDIDATNAAIRSNYMVSKTQLPCVEIGTGNTSCEFKVPFLTPYDWFDQKSQDYTWGKIYLDVLSPLTTGSGGPTTAGLAIYLSFEDFEFCTPIYPQMEIWPTDSVVHSAQVAKKFSKEVDAVSSKPISTALSYGAKAADSLSAIPLLKPVTEAASWVLNVASGVVGAFGWSKPVIEDASMTVSAQPNRYMATSDGADTSLPLGLIAERKVDIIDDMSIYNEDEMSFNFLKSRHALVGNYAWSTTDATGTVIFSQQIGPQTNSYVEKTLVKSTHTSTYRIGPPIYYLAQKFGLWRGSINVMLKFVKTNFHTGRLDVTWTPGTGSFTAPTTTQSAYSLREIIDISDADEICLNLPYLLGPDYLPTSSVSGLLQVRVLAPLRCPETASSSIQILKYISGGADFEFQVPYNGTSVQPFYAQMESLPVDRSICVAQMESACVTKDSMVAPGVLCGDGTVSLAKCSRDIGECFTSIHQLLNRANRIFFRIGDPFSTAQALINPWFSSISYMVAATGALDGPTPGGDVFSFLSPMYGYFRGDARIALQCSFGDPVGGGSFATVLGTLAQPNFPTRYSFNAETDSTTTAVADWVSTATNVDGFCSTGIVAQGSQGFSSMLVPYCSNGKASLVRPYFADGAYTTVDRSDPRLALRVAGVQLATANVVCYRSMTDNFQFTFFIGCPPLLVSYV